MLRDDSFAVTHTNNFSHKGRCGGKKISLKVDGLYALSIGHSLFFGQPYFPALADQKKEHSKEK
jgi:hypothetical protein